MTISDLTNQTSADGTNTAGQEVPFEFPIVETTDIGVKTRVITTGVEADLVETTDYTVDIDGTSGGTVTMVNAIATTKEIHITRDTPLEQTLDLELSGEFSSEDVEAQFDEVAKILIELSNAPVISAPLTDDNTTSLVIPSTIDRASKFFTFDANGEPTATDALDVGVVAFGTFGESVAGTANEAAFKTLANLEIGTDVQAYDADLGVIAGLTKGAYYFLVCNSGGTAWTATTPANARTAIGISSFGATLIDDTTAAAARTTLGVTSSTDTITAASIVAWENEVIFYENEVVTYV